MRLDLDNLLGLLFFVVFIILPIFSRSNKKKGQQPPGRPTTGGPLQAPVAPDPSRQASARNVPLPGQPTASADRGASTTITLEDIRRRVAEAQQRELESRKAATAASSAPTSLPTAPPGRPSQRGLVSSDPFEQTLVGGVSPVGMGREGTAPLQPQGQPGQPRPSPLGREGSPGGTAQPGRAAQAARTAPRTQRGASIPSPLGREGTDRTARAAAAVIGESSAPIQRRQAGQSSKLSPIGPLAFDRSAIMQGLIWHEILGEPPSIKRLRRTRSRLH